MLGVDTHQTVSEFDPSLHRDAKSRATLRAQAQALDAVQAHMLGVSEQVSLAELATELAEARAAFMEQQSGDCLRGYDWPGMCAKRPACVSLLCKAILPFIALFHMQMSLVVFPQYKAGMLLKFSFIVVSRLHRCKVNDIADFF